MTTKRGRATTVPDADAARQEKIEFAFRFAQRLIDGLIQKIRERGERRGMEPVEIDRAVAGFHSDVLVVLAEIRSQAKAQPQRERV